jgi:hypothetical protein
MAFWNITLDHVITREKKQVTFLSSRRAMVSKRVFSHDSSSIIDVIFRGSGSYNLSISYPTKKK